MLDKLREGRLIPSLKINIDDGGGGKITRKTPQNRHFFAIARPILNALKSSCFGYFTCAQKSVSHIRHLCRRLSGKPWASLILRASFMMGGERRECGYLSSPVSFWATFEELPSFCRTKWSFWDWKMQLSLLGNTPEFSVHIAWQKKLMQTDENQENATTNDKSNQC